MEDLHELIGSDLQDILLSKKSKVQKSIYRTLPLHIAKEGDLRKHTCTCSSMQNKYRKDKPETKETGYLQGVGKKRLERIGKCEWNKVAGMRRVRTSLSLFV